MIGNLLSNKDFTRYFVYATIFAVAFNRAYGLSNLLRFALRYFGVGYTDSKMKNLDNRWFDIQLFKIINGINSSNINDIRLIQRGLNEGQLKPSSFFLTSSWGDIMRAPPCQEKNNINSHRFSVDWLGFIFLVHSNHNSRWFRKS